MINVYCVLFREEDQIMPKFTDQMSDLMVSREARANVTDSMVAMVRHDKRPVIMVM